MDKKQFVLDTLLPFFINPSSCAVVQNDNGDKSCLYRAAGNKRCALGKHIRDDAYNPEMENKGASEVLQMWPDCLTPEAHAMGFTDWQWAYIQSIHDGLAANGFNPALTHYIEDLENSLKISLPELKEFIKQPS